MYRPIVAAGVSSSFMWKPTYSTHFMIFPPKGSDVEQSDSGSLYKILSQYIFR